MRAVPAVAVLWSIALIGAAAQSRSAYPGMLDQHPAIDYAGGALNDVVTTLVRDVDAGKTTLRFEGTQGFLRSVLEHLQVPVSSQILVFSKTGIQHPFTSPEHPRAFYFNDRVVVGYIPGAPLLELASHDPRQGIVFQTIAQTPVVPLQAARPERCLSCHLSANSLDIPGILVRSNFTDPNGRSLPQLGNFLVDHRTPLAQRWGGWYVTGTHGAQRHMGNSMVASLSDPESAITDATLNRTTLSDRVDAAAYPRATSDIAALLVFDHQGRAMNLITRLGWEARAGGDVRPLAQELAAYLALTDEITFTWPIKGVSEFASEFAGTGPRDSKGRSLRELDLQSRLFKYRCSYMIYSPAFDALPADAKSAVLARLRELITDPDTIAILDETKAGWR